MKSISTIIIGKIAKKIEKMSLSAIVSRLRWFGAFILLSIVIISPHTVGEWLTMFVQGSGVAYYRVFMMGLAIIYRREIWKGLKGFKNTLLPDIQQDFGENELILQFLCNNTINRDGIVKNLGYSRDEADELLNNLDNLNITERGTNNARILNSELSTCDILSRLEHGQDTVIINKPVLNRSNSTSLEYSPTPLSEVFTKRRIS